ncbi:MAG TPA: HdeD family acid-resistance protein [Stellaceae bacterium]|nr:HdeD family acid-resistance protein [Stellaceae bacterium]
MNNLLARNWWALALRGVAAILFGIVAFAMPGLTLTVLIYFFAGYLLVDGVLALIAGLRAAERHERWGMLALEGVLNLAAGALVVIWPAMTLLLFIYIAAFWGIVTGGALLIDAVRLHRRHGEWLMILAGLSSLVWGVLVALFPIAGILVWAWWIGAYALIFGIAMLVLAFRLRKSHAA